MISKQQYEAQLQQIFRLLLENSSQEEIESLKLSISDHGLFNPISVVRTRDSDKLTVSGGRRRFRALKELGWKQIPVNIMVEDATETDIKIIAVNENLHRKELKDVEKGFGILSTFESKEYTGDQAIQGTKSLDNWFSQNKGKTWDDLIKELSSLIKKRGQQANEIRYDKNFIETCKSIGKTPKYQYQLLQIVHQLDPDVLVVAQKAGLSIKKSLLTNSRLLDHPEIQKGLIKEIGSMDDEEAAYEVRQKINDLETGYIKPAGGGLLAQWRTKGKDS